jgi:hypothetical protein
MEQHQLDMEQHQLDMEHHQRAQLQHADTLQAVAAWLTREEAGRLLAPLCQAGRALVRAADAAEDAADAAEDAGQPEAQAMQSMQSIQSIQSFWRAGPPMWDINHVCARIGARWNPPVPNFVPNLDDVLRSLATTLDAIDEYKIIERVFERRAARAGLQASVLGYHRLRVLDPARFLWHMEGWARQQFSDPVAHPTGRAYGGGRNDPKTLLVVNLLALLGLRPRRGRGMRFPPDPNVHPVHATREPLWNREYIAQSLSARGWV